MKKIVLILFCLVIPAIIFSQILTKDIPFALTEEINLDNVFTYEIKNFDCQQYLLQDKENIFKTPYRFAVNNEPNLTFNTIQPIFIDEFEIRYIKISVPNCKGLAVTFENFELSNDEKIFIFDNKLEYLLGSYTKSNNNKFNKLPTAFIPSDTIIIEYVTKKSAEINLSVSDIGIAYRPVIGDSDWCEVNINCYEDSRWQTLKKTTLKFVYKEDKSKSYYYCSGTLLANTLFSDTPYFLTANHCVNSESEASSSVFYFNYESIDCEGDIINEGKTISGASLISTADDNLDFSLLQLSLVPPADYEPFYAGWSRIEEYNDTSICIHHPAGDIKKISFCYSPLAISSFSGYDVNKHWNITEWNVGTTEGGSSGSGLFTTDMLLIGDLSGGEASCDYNYNDLYQQFYHCWDDYNSYYRQLQHWLDPYGFNPMQMKGYDPYENTDLAVPLNFSASLEDSLVTIHWSQPDVTPDEYIIYKNLEEFDRVNSPQYLTDILENDGVYVYYATAIYSDKESKPSDMSAVLFGDTTTIPKVTKIKLYPNPTNEKLNIISPDTIPMTKIEVFNSLGQNMRIFETEKTNYITLDLSGLENSYYFLKITTTGDVYIEKIIFIRKE